MARARVKAYPPVAVAGGADAAAGVSRRGDRGLGEQPFGLGRSGATRYPYRHVALHHLLTVPGRRVNGSSPFRLLRKHDTMPTI